MSAFGDWLKNIKEEDLSGAKKKVVVFYALILLAILILYFYAGFGPSLGRLFRTLPKIKSLALDIKDFARDAGQEAVYAEERGKLASTLADYEKKLSREKEVPMLLENLSKMAISSRVKILGITPLGKPPKKQEAEFNEKDRFYHEVPILINAESGYHELGDFISRLENDERFLQVSDIDIKSNKANPKRHTVEILVYAYTIKGNE